MITRLGWSSADATGPIEAIGKTSIAKVTPYMTPFFFAMFAALMLITYWPPLTMWLPSLAIGADH